MPTSVHKPENREPAIVIKFLPNESGEYFTQIRIHDCVPVHLLYSFDALILSFLNSAEDKKDAMLNILKVAFDAFSKYESGDYKTIPLDENNSIDNKNNGLKIFYVNRNDGANWDEYDSAVVVAHDEKEAIEILKKYHTTGEYNGWGSYDVSVKEVVTDFPRIVIESFNAG